MKKPNVVFVLTDDQGYGEIGAHGNPYIQTPHLDRLHAESVRFTDFHVGTTCAPTRAGLLTGHNCNSAGVWHTIGGRSLLREDEWTLAPHDWAIAGPFDRKNYIDRKVAKGQADLAKGVQEITGRTGGLPHTGEGWYRRWIDVPATAQKRCYRLECDGIMSHANAYCNGTYAGGWPYGYSSFALDLSHLLLMRRLTSGSIPRCRTVITPSGRNGRRRICGP